ncbi:hypothetical protein [Geothermobacter hydrogeniphilus]|uniref:Uncharacterized protein n=1 Tax=Geothermobacter hydrogeniphilus TaxID=1969733 RepID=A0A1X0XLI8_9BACT|nr:hypothetical protein [Geothermobacter hydrogeniphilus]ORJ53697.1 hypothetical protein B5V00_16200 [Geothermobacter hydrogeniphilus]
MPNYVEIPRALLSKIKLNCPDVYELLVQLGNARDASDSSRQKVLRKKLREKGFYLSRLAEGEDPFVHWSICSGNGTDRPEQSDDNLLTEDEVVLKLTRWLESSGWEIITQCLGHQQGIDILAIKGTQTLIVEAKGAKGSKTSPVTKRDRFTSGQIKTHFGKAIVKCLEERARNIGAEVAIAQPNNPYLRDCLADACAEVTKIGIQLYWVEADGSVEIEYDSQDGSYSYR